MEWLSDIRIGRLRELMSAPDTEEFRYRILEEIGRGGMGTVYRAKDCTLGREVALKALNSGIGAEHLLERMRREGFILARLEHPGIVPIHDAGTLPDGRAYYAMKLVHGKRLDEYCAHPQPLPELLRVFLRICEPVEFAHANGIVHRDLKPQNIIVGAFGEVLVLDWGVAKILNTAEKPVDAGSQSETATAHGTVVGTPGYMAPEQSAGRSTEVDRRSDVYALGRVLSFLLESASSAQKPPKRLLAIAAKASAEDRTARYDDMAGLAADIGRFLDGRPVTAYRENIVERMAIWIGRHKTLTALVLAYLVMRALLIIFLGR